MTARRPIPLTRRKAPMHALTSLVLAAPLVLAGCFAPSATPARVSFTAAWEPWGDDPVDHLVLRMRNTGDLVARLGPEDIPITVAGPQGPVPIDWGAERGARELAPGEALELALHPRMPGDRMVLSVDHAAGSPMPPPRGSYTVCVQGDCRSTRA